ncbi:protein SPIRAL1-like 3 isoform X2 [Carica papaya]|nr:protein SPIRAL1-like 3 isoform X2 [Carica papaya]XP_021893226.1 protein SPIRAL1-like 3 isoform X2 [Carica papaya]
MGRGISNGGGQSSLGYLFGSGEAPNPNPNTNKTEALQNQKEVAKHGPSQDSSPAVPRAEVVPRADVGKEIPAGVPGNMVNNYFRADGQNRGNFLTDRPSTKVHAAPGGGSSLDYLFSGGGK